MKKEALQQEICNEVKKEKEKWQDALVYITENVAFRTRDLIKTLRKNYWGIYDNPRDPTTGRKKIWVPLSEQIAETHVKHTNMDSNDVRFRALNVKGRQMTDMTRAVWNNYANISYFGQDLNQSNRQLSIDGTFVWKTTEENGMPKRHNVDLLNFYIDPMADSIHQAARVTERILMTPEEIRSHSGWINTEDVEGSEDLQKIDKEMSFAFNKKSNVKYVDVWEMWGLVPEYFITGDTDDTDQVEAHVVISGIEAGETTLHYCERNTNKDRAGEIIKPYEECWHTKVQNRWYGRGPVEQVLMLQLWLNTSVNIRVNRSFLTQMGIFKIRKGSGITPKQLQNVPQNGGIVVNSMEDIENFTINDVSQSAYTEENRIIDWAQRVSAAYDHVAGEALPAETPATNASLQDQNSKSTFMLVKQNWGFFLERWIDRHAMPILAKNITAQDMVRISGDDKEVQRFFNRVVAHRASKEFDVFEAQLMETKFRNPEDVERAIQKAERMKAEMQNAVNKMRQDPDIFAEVFEEMSFDQVSCDVYFNDEKVNTQVMVNDLITMLQVAPEFKGEIVSQIFNLLNLDQPNVNTQQQADPQQQQQEQPEQQRSPKQMTPQSAGNLASQSATMNNRQRMRPQPQQ